MKDVQKRSKVVFTKHRFKPSVSRPVASTPLNFKLGLAKSKYPALLIILFFVNFEHPSDLSKLGLKFSGVGATGPQQCIPRVNVVLYQTYCA